MDPEHAEALADAFEAFDADPEQHVAVFWGEGGAFCAGWDLKHASQLVGKSAPLAALDFPQDNSPVPRGPMGPSRLQLSKPVIAAVAGPAVAGGFELALWCDVRVMEEDAYFGVYCRRWGIPLLDGGTIRLPKLVGQGRALEIIMTGRKVPAKEALRIGACEKIVPKGEAREAAEAMAQEIARFPQECMRADRLSVRRNYGLAEMQALEGETQRTAASNGNCSRVRELFREEYGHFINGEWVGGDSGQTIDMINPATGEILSKIQAGNAVDAKRAVEAAAAAFPAWSKSSRSERQHVLYEMSRRLKNRLSDYAMMVTLDNGKPIMEAMHFDLPMAIEQFEFFSGAPWFLHGESIDTENALGVVIREPLGVCAQIIPWNVPLIMMAAKIAPALAAGNTLVLKPAETVCLSVLEFFREMADLLPPGVANVITGYGPDVGEALITHPQVRKVAFTGSRPTAQKLMQYASANIIPQTMELGGKSANIVCEDADLDAAAEGAAMSTILNKGEVCLAGSRLFLHEKIRDQFLDKFLGILAGVRAGDPTLETTQLGPQASQAQYDKILGYLQLGQDEGATALTGGKAATGTGLDGGLFIEPTVFVDVDNSMRIAQEEIFGPVTSVITWKSDEEVLRLANASIYGLGGGLWTGNLARAHRIARGMETGTIWVNRYYNFLGGMPVGGYKQSGFGREFASEVLNHYTTTKSVIINLQEGPIGAFG